MAKEDDVTGRAGGKARAKKLSAKRKTEIAKLAAKARWESPNSNKRSDTRRLPADYTPDPNTPVQLDFLRIEKQIEIDGVGMGVLSDGTPFLTGRGLARICGINAGRISEMQSAWDAGGTATMATKVKEIVASRGITLSRPYIEIKQRSGTFYAYSDVLCLAVLEYYAFDAPIQSEEAKKNFRLLAGKALADFIFAQVGYDPSHSVPDEWKQFHDRVALTYNSLPRGYFGIFKELSDMIVTLGQSGLQIDSKFVPDISVGTHWANHWNDRDLAQKHGERRKYDHNFPEYFPQSKSNPQDVWCYPDSALGEFRRWLQDDYIEKGKFKKYIAQKVRDRQLPVSFAQLAVAAYGIENDQQDSN